LNYISTLPLCSASKAKCFYESQVQPMAKKVHLSSLYKLKINLRKSLFIWSTSEDGPQIAEQILKKYLTNYNKIINW